MTQNRYPLITAIRRRPSARALVAAAVGLVAVVALAASADDNEATLVGPDNGQQEGGATGDAVGGTNGDGGDADNAGDSVSGPFAVGDTVALGDWEITVNGVQDPWTSPDGFDSGATGRYVEIDVTVVNNSDRPETVSSLLCFNLRDADGRAASDAFVVGGGTAPDGEVDPGGRISGNLYYDVPVDATGLELRFQCDFLARGSAVFTL